MTGVSNKKKPRDPEPEVVEVEVERLGVRPTYGEALRGRFKTHIVPVLLAMMIDLGDFFTFPGTGAIALPFGLLAGYLFSSYLKVAPTWQVIITCVVGVYWAASFTTFIPLATIIATMVQIFDPAKWKEEPFA